MKRITTLLAIIALPLISFAQTDIADARTFTLLSTITVTGIVTNGSELSIIRYIQDGSAGIACYPGTGSVPGFNPNRGDSITVTGILKDYNNLLEIDPISSFTIISTGNPSPTPLVITPNGQDETTESELVQFDNAVFANGGSTFSGNTNYVFTASSEVGEVRINSNSNLVGTLIPVAPVSIVALASQFFTTYQSLPRDVNDIILGSPLFLTSALSAINITTSSVDLSWTTNSTASSTIKYGLTNALEIGEVNDPSMVSSHTISLTGLTAATIYYVQAYSVSGVDTGFSNTKVISTASNSTGQIIAYFNNTVENGVSTGTNATYVADFPDTIIAYINKATTTLDICVYNCNNLNLVAAINNAFNNGVTVRYVTALSTLNLALSSLDTANIKLIKGNSVAIMHNKFIIVDRDDVNNSWVLTGSTNWTTNNLTNDYNNILLIQDQSVARAYTLEFEEMWGGTGSTPNPGNAKFGADKTDNTPHEFMVGGKALEVYFSPTDLTTSKIKAAIESASASLEFGLLSFTRDELGTAVNNAHIAFGNVKGIMENIGDMGEEYTFLTGAGVPLLSHQGVTYDFHHKYAIIDQMDTTSDPLVLTGSHNWSTAAETKNDENTVFVHRADIANEYYQEFFARYCELDNSFCLAAGVEVTATSVSTNCNGDCNGTATAVQTNGTAPITYAWNDPASQTNATATGLCAGNYAVTVTDSSTSATATATVSEPAILAGPITATGETSAGAGDGTATAVPTGGTGSYTYVWNDSGTQTNATATGLAPGIYVVAITDANGCTYSASTFINAGGCTTITGTVTSTDESNAGVNDGTATVVPTTGTAPYTYSWNTTPGQTNATATGLAGGNYEVIIADANGCGGIVQVTVNTLVGINHIADKLDFKVYPNPANSGVFFIESGEPISGIEVFNTTGQLLYGVSGSLPLETIQIDLKNARSGIYLVRVRFENDQVETRRLVIE